MFVPSEFASGDPNLPWVVIDENPFATLVHGHELDATHLPLLLERSEARQARLRGHLARRNPASAGIAGARFMAAFAGADAYVSPGWYLHPERSVPTWNYVVAHAWGVASPLDRDATLELLDEMCVRFEGDQGYRPSDLPAQLREDMLSEIVGFEIEVERVELKLKLSQNRSAQDRQRVMAGLAARGARGDQAVIEWMQRMTSA